MLASAFWHQPSLLTSWRGWLFQRAMQWDTGNSDGTALPWGTCNSLYPTCTQLFTFSWSWNLWNKQTSHPSKEKRYPQVSLNLNQEMESNKSSVLEVIGMDNSGVKLHLTSHCPSCKTQPRLVKYLHLTVTFISLSMKPLLQYPNYFQNQTKNTC